MEAAFVLTCPAVAESDGVGPQGWEGEDSNDGSRSRDSDVLALVKRTHYYNQVVKGAAHAKDQRSDDMSAMRLITGELDNSPNHPPVTARFRGELAMEAGQEESKLTGWRAERKLSCRTVTADGMWGMGKTQWRVR